MELEKKLERATQYKESGNELFQQASKTDIEQSRNELLQKALDAYVEVSPLRYFLIYLRYCSLSDHLRVYQFVKHFQQSRNNPTSLSKH